MRITTSQLRRIIKKEVKNVTEPADPPARSNIQELRVYSPSYKNTTTGWKQMSNITRVRITEAG